eukprot:XP_001704026.1 Hypothetical protein GL50803_88181 [Giardia lamblia ATCC 50803]
MHGIKGLAWKVNNRVYLLSGTDDVQLVLTVATADKNDVRQLCRENGRVLGARNSPKEHPFALPRRFAIGISGCTGCRGGPMGREADRLTGGSIRLCPCREKANL